MIRNEVTSENAANTGIQKAWVPISLAAYSLTGFSQVIFFL